MALNRKWHEIDVLALYSNSGTNEWNAFLNSCSTNEDILTLEKTYYGLQVGMDKLVKNKLNTEKINSWFLRLTRSIEITVKRIYRAKYPSVLDDPATAIEMKNSNPLEYKRQLQLKRNRDQQYEKWLRKVAF